MGKPGGKKQAKAPDWPIWYKDMMPGGWGEGFYVKSQRHAVIMVERPAPDLVVSFENMSQVHDREPTRQPWGSKFARENRLSHLGIMSNVTNWYRDSWLISLLQTYADDGFFESYNRVLFTGNGMGAFAALAFSALVPNAYVAAFSPQSTLDPERVPWEERFASGRRQDWSLPFGDGLDSIQSAAKVALFYDPTSKAEVQHVERLEAPNVTAYKCLGADNKCALYLNRMGKLRPVMREVLFDTLTEHRFYTHLRDRRILFWHKNRLAAYFNQDGRDIWTSRVENAFAANREGKDTSHLQPFCTDSP